MIKQCFVLIIFLQFFAQELVVFTDVAYKKNPILKSYDEKIKATANRANVAAYLPDPSLKFNYFLEEIVTANGSQTAQVQLNQKIPWFGTLSLKEERIKETKNSVIELKKNYQIELKAKITNTYYRLSESQAKYKVYNNYITVLGAFYQSTLSHYQNGNGSQQDILKVQTEISVVENQQILLKAAIKHSINEIRSLSFYDSDTIIAVFPRELQQSKAINSYKQNHQIQSLLHLKKQSILAQEIASKKKLPDLVFGFSYHFIKEKSGFTTNKDAYSFSFGVTLPIWSGKYSYEEESFFNQMNEIDYKIQNKEKVIKERVDFLFYDLKAKKESLALFEKKLIPKAELTFKASLSAYETGNTDFINLLDSKRMLLRLTLQEIEIHKMYYLSLSELNKLTSYMKEGE